MRQTIAIILFFILPFSLCAQSSTVPKWKVCYDSAQLYWAKDWPKTIPLLARAERSALLDLGMYDDNYLAIINDLGLAYANVQDFTNAEKLLNKSLAISAELNAPPDDNLYRTMLNLAGVHGRQGHFKEAEQLYNKVITAPLVAGEVSFYTQAVHDLISLYETNDKLDLAQNFLTAATIPASFGAQDQSILKQELEISKARIKRRLGKYQEAGVILDRVTRALQGQQDKTLSSLYIQSLQETGLLNSETGYFNTAEKNLLQAFRLLKSSATADNVRLIEVLNNLGSVYEKLGIKEKALVYYQDALALCSAVHGENSLYTLTLQSNITGIELKQGEIPKAIQSYENIEKRLKAITPESNRFYITLLNNLAMAYRAGTQSDKALTTLEKASALIQKYALDKEDLAASVLNNIAVLLTAKGDSRSAIVYYEKAYALRKAIYGETSVLLMDLASNMAVVYWELHKPELAIPLFQHSISLALRQVKYIFPSLSEDEQVEFYKRLKEDFERFNTIAFQSAAKNPELLTQVFNNQITIKSLLFFTQQRRRDLIHERRDSVLIKQNDLLKSKREQLGYYYQLSLANLAHTQLTSSTLEKEIDALEKAISLKTSETIAEKTAEQNIRWSTIQQRIKSEEALVEIIRFRKYDLKKYAQDNTDRVSFGFTDSVYYGALITTQETKANPAFVFMKDGWNMETRFLSYYRNALSYSVPDANSYPAYWKPFESTLQRKTKIYISGDGVYHRLNLNTLRDPETEKFLIERYDIHYLLNPAQYLERQKASFISKNAILMGDPVFDLPESGEAKSRTSEQFTSLPGTNLEVVMINEILKSKAWTTHVYLKKLATERNLKTIHSPDILHVATHGFFSTGRVTLSTEAKKDFLFHSGLILSGANRNLGGETKEIQDDGILTAYEVMNLNLAKTHLVVLSACETGLGKIENGEGVYGLQRAFLQAGARNIMISLWKVDDKLTQELMVKFYQQLFQGQPEREALKHAQLEQLKKYPNPLGWGGFIMIGLD